MPPPRLRTPGVYIAERSAFPNSVVAVPTAVPAFIGYTPRTKHNGRSLLRVPTRISSLAEFAQRFGALPDTAVAPRPRFRLTPAAPPPADAPPPPQPIIDASTLYHLVNSLRLYYANGGGPCYIVSVGAYRRARRGADARRNPNIKLRELLAGLHALEREPEPTLVLAPDAALLSIDDHAAFNQAMLLHCSRLQSRIALLDVPNGDDPDPSRHAATIASFRASLGSTALSYGAAYYPFLHTTVLASTELTYAHFGGASALAATLPDAKTPKVKALLTHIRRRPTPSPPPAALDAALALASPAYAQLKTAALARANILPPSGALAGVIVTVDHARGVWKAPANVALQAVTAPTLPLTSADQESLNLDATEGKSINAIRAFPGRGVQVWGARTLEGNSQDWRYINVRRTCIMIEQSIKHALASFVFQPNDANTWISIRSMLENFLTGLWQQGALAGAKPDDAFAVQVGLGTTMTAQDILDGRLNVQVLVALIRPAEFIVLTFQQQMQKA